MEQREDPSLSRWPLCVWQCCPCPTRRWAVGLRWITTSHHNQGQQSVWGLHSPSQPKSACCESQPMWKNFRADDYYDGADDGEPDAAGGRHGIWSQGLQGHRGATFHSSHYLPTSHHMSRQLGLHTIMNSRKNDVTPVMRLGTSPMQLPSPDCKSLKDKKGLNVKGALNAWEDGSPKSRPKGPWKVLLPQGKMCGSRHTVVQKPNPCIERGCIVPLVGKGQCEDTLLLKGTECWFSWIWVLMLTW